MASTACIEHPGTPSSSPTRLTCPTHALVAPHVGVIRTRAASRERSGRAQRGRWHAKESRRVSFRGHLPHRLQKPELGRESGCWPELGRPLHGTRARAGEPDQGAHRDVKDVARFSANPYHLGSQHLRSRTFIRPLRPRRRPTPCGAKTVSLSLPRPRPDTDHALERRRHGRPHAPRVSSARSREAPQRRGSGHRRHHDSASGTRGRRRLWLAPPWPSPLPRALSPTRRPN
jgi:hypothetical protein